MQDINYLISQINYSDKRLFILCGYPYAGKSYLAKTLLEKTGVSLVSIDSILKERGYDWDTNVLPSAEVWTEIFNESYDDVRKILSSGANVLYDSTNHTIASRSRLREVAKSVNASTFVVYVKTKEETIWKRWEKNKSYSSRSVVSRELVRETLDAFETPSDSENLIIIEN